MNMLREQKRKINVVMDNNMSSDMNTGMDVTMEQTPGMDMDILIGGIM
jgi:hypothetical protein